MIKPQVPDERPPVTPRRLAIWGLEGLGAGIAVSVIYVIVSVVISNPDSKPTWMVMIVWILWAVGAVLLLAAGAAKVIAIGVRSGHE